MVIVRCVLNKIYSPIEYRTIYFVTSVFFETYANNDTLEGNASAKTALKLFNYRDIYVEPFSIENENNQGRSALLAETASPESLKTVALIEKSFKVYPNPSNETVFINYQLANGPDLELEIKDALGKVVYKNKIKANTNLSIALDGIKNGVYLLSSYDKNNLVYKTKIVVIK